MNVDDENNRNNEDEGPRGNEINGDREDHRNNIVDEDSAGDMVLVGPENHGNNEDESPENHSENEAQSGERKRKRAGLRSAEADLKVIVGNEAAGEDNEEGKQAVYWYVSHVLASQSGYVDTLLSTRLPTNNDLNQSQDHKEITFPDIEPSQWERMMKFLADPYSMSEKDTFEIAALYDKYDFKNGIKICDGVLSEKCMRPFFLDNLDTIEIDSSKMERMVQATVLSQKLNLRKTFHWGRHLLSHLLDYYGESRFPLTASQLAQLIPTITRDDELGYYYLEEGWETTDRQEIWKFEEHLNGGGKELGFGLKDSILTTVASVNSFDVTDPLLPDLFIKSNKLEVAQNFVAANLKCIVVVFKLPIFLGTEPEISFRNVSGTGCYWKFFYRGSDHVNKHLLLSKSTQWELTENGRTKLICRDSESALVPPKDGWVDASSGRKQDFELDYIWEK